MNILNNVLFAVLITACYLVGGQIEKSVRRYGVPSFSFAFAMLKEKKNKWRLIFLLGMIGILSIGYGEDSFLKKWLKDETLTRLVFSQLLALIFILAGGSLLLSPIILAIAFQVRAGVLFKIKKFEVLIEDICRAGAIFACTYITTINLGV